MESYVSKEVAKLLHENGFEAKDKTDACPTLKMAQEWLADKHHLFVVVEPDDKKACDLARRKVPHVFGVVAKARHSF